LLSIGTSVNLTKETNINSLINNFDISNLSSSSPKFSIDVLRLLNKDILQKYSYSDVRGKLQSSEIDSVNENFWLFVQNNIQFFHEYLDWMDIVFSTNSYDSGNPDLLKEAVLLIPDQPYDLNTWDDWIALIKKRLA
jgi:hypothetical protein